MSSSSFTFPDSAAGLQSFESLALTTVPSSEHMSHSGRANNNAPSYTAATTSCKLKRTRADVSDSPDAGYEGGCEGAGTQRKRRKLRNSHAPMPKAKGCVGLGFILPRNMPLRTARRNVALSSITYSTALHEVGKTYPALLKPSEFPTSYSNSLPPFSELSGGDLTQYSFVGMKMVGLGISVDTPPTMCLLLPRNGVECARK
ncbi:unnamed protein product [Somion occarium]|uniref:Uncharacterized protein n=1 Tax=Somion occarium TaxID=3059160 RepID=A0ABP1E9G0_9APHY